MPRLDRLPEASRNAALTLPVPINDGAPYTRPRRPLKQSTLAIVTTAGLHLRHDRPFGGGDPSFRVIPSTATEAELAQSHASIGFDRTLTQRDVNIVYPIDRLRELVARGELGGLGPNCYSFMGAQRDWTKIGEETAPEVAHRLVEEGVDAVLLTPT